MKSKMKKGAGKFVGLVVLAAISGGGLASAAAAQAETSEIPAVVVQPPDGSGKQPTAFRPRTQDRFSIFCREVEQSTEDNLFLCDVDELE